MTQCAHPEKSRRWRNDRAMFVCEDCSELLDPEHARLLDRIIELEKTIEHLQEVATAQIDTEWFED